MSRDPSRTRVIFWLAVFAAAMALVESAIVVHLRHLYYSTDPRTIFPLRLLSAEDLRLELAREAATLAMILAVALTAERGAVRVAAAFAYVFGIWDIFYYVWLRVFIGWPTDWLQWDVLFLIPWPWFGPWVTPAAVAGLMTLWGGWLLGSARSHRFTATALLVGGTGAARVRGAFLEPGYYLLPAGAQGFDGYQPGVFSWILYFPGYVLMLAGAALVIRSGRASTWSV